VDLAVSQNGAGTKLFRNVTRERGLHVRLGGGSANPHGIGAILRAKRAGRLGPAREVRAGSGYWSQDSLTQVLPRASEITVLWPGGKRATYAVSAGAGGTELSEPAN
jgi:enediyne biosynthesis protein E4